MFDYPLSKMSEQFVLISLSIQHPDILQLQENSDESYRNQCTSTDSLAIVLE